MHAECRQRPAVAGLDGQEQATSNEPAPLFSLYLAAVSLRASPQPVREQLRQWISGHSYRSDRASTVPHTEGRVGRARVQQRDWAIHQRSWLVACVWAHQGRVPPVCESEESESGEGIDQCARPACDWAQSSVRAGSEHGHRHVLCYQPVDGQDYPIRVAQQSLGCGLGCRGRRVEEGAHACPFCEAGPAVSPAR
eukprot:3939730-Amphidinium_carterae.1